MTHSIKLMTKLFYCTFFILIIIFCSCKNDIHTKENKYDDLQLLNELYENYQKKDTVSQNITKEPFSYKGHINEKFYYLIKETDSSYQVGTHQFFGGISGWTQLKESRIIEYIVNSEEAYDQSYSIKKNYNDSIITNFDNHKVTFKFKPLKPFVNKVYAIDRFTRPDRISTLYTLRKKDLDSSYVYNYLKEKERKELIADYGESYKQIMQTDEIEYYQDTPDSLYIMYVLKDHYVNGPFIDEQSKFLVDQKILANTYQFTNTDIINTLDTTKNRIISIKTIGVNQYVIQLDQLPVKDSDELIQLQDIDLLLVLEGDNWISKEFVRE